MSRSRSRTATRRSRRRLLRWLAAAALLACLGCLHALPRGSGGLAARNVELLYEGTCAHLACCSVHGQRVPAGTTGAFSCQSDPTLACAPKAGWYTPGFTCNPYERQRYRQPGDAPFVSCHDTERWLAIPGLTHELCGLRLLVCHNGRRVTALARDAAAPNGSGNRHFEGSLGLLRAIGADPSDRHTEVSIYDLSERQAIAGDPHCVGAPP